MWFYINEETTGLIGRIVNGAVEVSGIVRFFGCFIQGIYIYIYLFIYLFTNCNWAYAWWQCLHKTNEHK
jgi:hypothetical protein